mgnify:CR=1 FL=1
MSWSFALVNNKLSEIFFEKKRGEVEILGHCYVKESDYKTKEEKDWIKEDIARTKVIYKNKKYKLIHRIPQNS